MKKKKAIIKATKKSVIKTYKIESGIKMPPPLTRSGAGEPSKVAATMNMLKPGESFLIRDPFEGLKAEKIMRDWNSRERKRGGDRLLVARRLKNGTRIWHSE